MFGGVGWGGTACKIMVLHDTQTIGQVHRRCMNPLEQRVCHFKAGIVTSVEFGRPVQNLIVQTEPVTRCYGVVPFRCVVGSGQQAISDGNAGFAADASVFNGSFKQDF